MQTTTPAAYRDLTRITLSVLGIGVLLGGSLWVMRPFLAPLLWAITIVVSTWPLLLRLQRGLGGRRGGAVAIMTVALLVILFVPLYLAVSTILAQSDRVVQFLQALPTLQVPPPPHWLHGVPIIGPKAVERWLALAALEPQQLAERLAPYLRSALTWFAAQAGSFGSTVLHFLITVIIAAILYTKGEAGEQQLRRFFRRLSGERGDAIVTLAGKAIRAVALGVVITAILQTALAAVGLFLVRVPFPGLISAVVLMLCIAQLGPLLALLPCVVWLYATGAPGRGTVLLVIMVVAQTVDNIMRPLLIKKGGADISLLLIIPGVIGGLLWLGIIGLFVGPVVLAVGSTLFNGWLSSGLGETEPQPVPAASASDEHDTSHGGQISPSP